MCKALAARVWFNAWLSREDLSRTRGIAQMPTLVIKTDVREKCGGVNKKRHHEIASNVEEKKTRLKHVKKTLEKNVGLRFLSYLY